MISIILCIFIIFGFELNPLPLYLSIIILVLNMFYYWQDMLFIIDLLLDECFFYNSEDFNLEYEQNFIKCTIKKEDKKIRIPKFKKNIIRGTPFIIVESYSKTKIYSYKELKINNYNEILKGD